MVRNIDPHPAPRGALLYGEPGTCHVWEHTTTGRKRWDFDDEYLAMQCAVRLGSVVEANDGGEPHAVSNLQIQNRLGPRCVWPAG